MEHIDGKFGFYMHYSDSKLTPHSVVPGSLRAPWNPFSVFFACVGFRVMLLPNLAFGG